MKKIILSAFLSAFVFLNSNAESIVDNSKTVSTNGVCIVEAENDRVSVDIKVSILSSESSQSAFASAQDTVNSIQNYVKSLNIVDLKLETKDVNIMEEKEWNSTSKKHEMSGYRAEIILSVDAPISEKKQISNIMDTASTYNGVYLGGFSLYISPKVMADVKTKCLAVAIKDAKNKANIIAVAGGSILGNLIKANYYANDISPSPVYFGNRDLLALESKSSEPMNIHSSEQTVTVTVDTTWEIK